MGVFRILPPTRYLRRFWTLVHKILLTCSPARGLSKSVEICGPKFTSFEKVGGFCFSPHRHISAVFELWSAKFWWPVALPDGFPIMSKYVDQSSSVLRKWGFSDFRPHRHISAVFQLWPTKFWGQVAVPDGFPKMSAYVDQSSSVSRKWGFSNFRPRRHISAVFELWLTKFWGSCSPGGLSKSVTISGPKFTSFRESGGFSIFAPSPYLRRFWNLASPFPKRSFPNLANL